MKRIKTVISLIICIAVMFGIFIPAFADGNLVTEPFSFDKHGHFKILHITDTHLHDDKVEDSVRLIALACDMEKPDLVMLTGDLASEDTFEHTKQLVDKLMSVFESRKIPTAVTFGNHDSENGAYTREEVMELYNSYSCSISIDDGETLTGCGTYLIPLCSSKGDDVIFNLWVFDSGDYDSEGHYANVSEDQVDWYKAASAESERQSGRKIYSLAFQHIIVPEIYDALEKKDYWSAFSYPHLIMTRSITAFPKIIKTTGCLTKNPARDITITASLRPWLSEGMCSLCLPVTITPTLSE